MFGGTIYRHVRFERCVFYRCDFGMAEFVHCQFESCDFRDSTGEHVSFSATEIGPTAIMSGMTPPLYNYGPTCVDEMSPSQLESQWLEIRRALAAQLLKSNGEIYHTPNCDAALVQLKTAELKVRINLLKSPTSYGGISRFFTEAIRCGVLWLILALTKGGTSKRPRQIVHRQEYASKPLQRECSIHCGPALVEAGVQIFVEID